MFWRKQQHSVAASADTTPTAAALAGGMVTPAKSGVPRNLLFVVAVALLVVMVGAKFIDDLRKGTFGNDGEVKQRPREVPPSDNETGKIGSAARAGVESVKPKKDLTEEQVRAAIAAPTELSTQAAIDSSRSRIASPPENPGTSSPTPPIAETKKTLVIDPDAPTPSGLLTPAGRLRGVDSAGAGSDPVLRPPKGALPAPESGKGQPTRDLLKEEQEVFNVRSSPLLARGETVPTNPEGRSSSSTQAAPVGSAPEKPPTSGDPIDSYLSLLSRANPGPGGSGAGSETRASWLSAQRNAKPEGVVLSQPALGGDVVLPASVLNLVTRTTIRSDLDGDVIAVVTDDVRDTVKGKSIVIPKGSQVLGSVSSNLQPGQERAFTAFRTLYFPDGRSFELRGLTGSDSAGAAGPETFLLVHGLQQNKKLRFDEEMSFSLDPNAGSNPGLQLNKLICEGASLGFHVIATCDTYNNVMRFLSRKALSEFEMRVVFQMSANDSASLIESPAANDLGLHRAILFNGQQGWTETFRPYALPDDHWLDEAGQKLAKLHA